MANMSYCRMENTFRDLQDCLYNINNVSSESERRYRERIKQLCEEFIYEFDNLDEDEEE